MSVLHYFPFVLYMYMYYVCITPVFFCLCPIFINLFKKNKKNKKFSGLALCSSSNSNIQRQSLVYGKDPLLPRPIPHIILSKFNIKMPKQFCQHKIHFRPCQTIARHLFREPSASSSKMQQRKRIWWGKGRGRGGSYLLPIQLRGPTTKG